MTLAQWLSENGMSDAAFAERLKVSRQSVYRYKNGRVPEPRVMELIYEATCGQVTANDFYELTAA